MKTSLAIPIALLAAVCLASPANATPKQDDAIVQLALDIGYPVSAIPITMAKAVCEDVGGGDPPLEEAGVLVQALAEQGFTITFTQAKQFTFAAMNIYCPESA